MTLKRTKEQIEFDLRMGVAEMTARKRWNVRHPWQGPLTPYETPESRAAHSANRRASGKKTRMARKDKSRAYQKHHRLLHPEAYRANQRRYRKKHRDKVREREAEYRKTHRQQRLLVQALYRITHRAERYAWHKQQVAALADWYVSAMFRRGTTLTSADVPPEIIVSVRSILHAKRKLHQLRNPVAVQHPNAG